MENYIDDFLISIDNLPSEILHLFSQLKNKDFELVTAKDSIHTKDINLRRLIKNSVIPSTPCDLDKPTDELLECTEQRGLFEEIRKEYQECLVLCDDKIKIADRAVAMLDRHIKRLQSDLEKLSATDQTVTVPTVPIIPPLPTIPPQPKPITPIPSLPDVTLLHPQTNVSTLGGLQVSAGSNNASSASLSSRKPTSPGRKTMRKQPRSMKRKSNALMEDGTGYLDGAGGGIGEEDSEVYCVCRQVSFGNMIACDGNDCPYEWFHYACVNLHESPVGVWYCPECCRKNSGNKKK